jgi:hypothetical protein
MVYRSDYMVYGFFLSIAGVVLFAALILIEKFLIKPHEKERRECCEAEIESNRLKIEEEAADKEETAENVPDKQPAEKEPDPSDKDANKNK